eukprot:g3648.t1
MPFEVFENLGAAYELHQSPGMPLMPPMMRAAPSSLRTGSNVDALDVWACLWFDLFRARIQWVLPYDTSFRSNIPPKDHTRTIFHISPLNIWDLAPQRHLARTAAAVIAEQKRL